MLIDSAGGAMRIDYHLPKRSHQRTPPSLELGSRDTIRVVKPCQAQGSFKVSISKLLPM